MTETARSPLFIQLDVQTLEDLHTGTGTGSGDVDALVQRDRQGRPVIRASHFKGLLREAGKELIAFGKATNEQLNHLLGAPGSSRGALRMTSLRVRIGGATLIWGSTKRVDGGRAPEEDTLRFVEHVAAGTHFRGQLRLPDASLEPLLGLLLSRVDRIGGDRNRGSGLVELDWRPGSAPREQQQAVDTGTQLRIVLRNLEPLSLPATGHPGSLIRSHSFIRGQALRGALIAWAIHGGHPVDPALFDHVSVSDALPLPEGSTAAHTVLPIPLSILTEKPSAGGADIPWWAGGSPAAPEFDSLGQERRRDEKPKRPGACEYLCQAQDGSPWARYTPRMNVRLRNATPDRGSQEEANLFSMEEIAEDTRFQADLHFADAARCRDFLAAFAPLLRGADWLGIGRGGQPAIVESIAAIQEQPSPSFSDDWTLTLVSDLILRGEHLGFLDDLDISPLCALAGIIPQDDWAIEKAVVESEPIYGFNAVSGLQRTPASAIRRGSCWRINGSGSAMLARALAERPALGERVREGFGRFLIDVQPIGELGRPGNGQAQPSVNRNEELLLLARNLAGRIGENGPSLSQLQWLRERALAAADDAQVVALLTEIESAPQRRPQGGKAWGAFQPLHLRDEIRRLQNLSEKRQLISYLVQWRVPAEKEKEKRG